ncbi:thioredoxin family protein [Gangjinia marincola]|uniref:Thioredoxin family protein n=1 Tax=Gangjinia marincola TaxID=578463 RepID=A0ABN1MCN2_9FLAO
MGILILSCQPENKKNKTTSFSGEIVNPIKDYVVLETTSKKTDTAFLTDKGEFYFSLDLDSAGLYRFSHYPEQQNIYLTPGDSLKLRLNTIEFDETLQFSGTRAAENNLLINLFLVDEHNDDLILTLYKKTPEEFEKISDSLSKQQFDRLTTLSQKHDFDPGFTRLISDLIQYETDYFKERYFYLLLKYNRSYLAMLPNDFFDYRDNINFNHPRLNKHLSITRFIDTYIQNKSIEDCDASYTQCFEHNNFDMLKRKIEIVRSLPLPQETTNYFLRKFGLKAIILANDTNHITSVLNLLDSMSNDRNNFEKIDNLAKIQQGYIPGNYISNPNLITPQKDTTNFKETVYKTTLIYTWSSRYPEHHINQHTIINNLKTQFEDMTFLGLNIDDDTDLWLDVMERYNYDPTDEYQLGKINLDRKLLYYYLDKTLLIDQGSKIIRGDLYLKDPLIVNKLDNSKKIFD